MQFYASRTAITICVSVIFTVSSQSGCLEFLDPHSAVLLDLVLEPSLSVIMRSPDAVFLAVRKQGLQFPMYGLRVVLFVRHRDCVVLALRAPLDWPGTKRDWL